MRQITRILAITSIHQLIVGLACMKKNKKEDNLYYDYLIINNTMMTDEAVISIKNATKHFQFCKIIDQRQRLGWFNDWKNHGADKINQSLPRKIRLLIQLFMNCKINHYKATKTVTNELIKSIGPDSPNEIYLRYKLNVPERLLLYSFPTADIYLFEDGLGDYIPKGEIKNVKNVSLLKYIISRLKQLILEKLFRINYQKFGFDKAVYARIKAIYELITNRDGWKKRLLLKNVSINPIDIGIHYVSILRHIKDEIFLNGFNDNLIDNSIILLPSNYSAARIWYPDVNWCTLDEEIKYINDIIKAIEKLSPGCKIIIKNHPRSPDFIIKKYKSVFSDKVTFFDLTGLPSELLFFNDSVQAVVGGLSSSLIYAKNLFNKDAYCVPFPDNGCTWSVHDKNVIRMNQKTLLRLGVKILNIQ